MGDRGISYFYFEKEQVHFNFIRDRLSMKMCSPILSVKGCCYWTLHKLRLMDEAGVLLFGQ